MNAYPLKLLLGICQAYLTVLQVPAVVSTHLTLQLWEHVRPLCMAYAYCSDCAGEYSYSRGAVPGSNFGWDVDSSSCT